MDFEFDEKALYAAGLSGFGGLLAFWMVNRTEISSMWALASGIFTVVTCFILLEFMWSR